MRYLVSNLYDFDPAVDRVALDRMQEVDRFALSRYSEMASAVIRAYETYDYPSVFHAINQFTTVDLSAFYADVLKDRLYTFSAGSPDRRSGQTALFIIADGLVRLLAPVLPMTSDELWAHLPGRQEESVHLAEFPHTVDAMHDAALSERWERLLRVRDEVNRALETERQAKTIGNSLGAKVVVKAWGDEAQLLGRYRDEDLASLFIVSQAEFVPVERDGSGVDVVVSRAEGSKCPRCWRVVPSVSTASGMEGLCDRCVDALQGASGTVAG